MEGFHENYAGHEAHRSSSDRAFGILFGAVFSIFVAHGFWKTGQTRWWALALSVAFFLVAAVSPEVLAPLNRLWLRLGALLHRIVSPIALGVMFFGVVWPVGLIMRLTAKDPLRLALKPEADSYWIDREPLRADHFKNLF